MKIKKIVVGILASFMLVGFSNAYKDGTYKGVYQDDEDKDHMDVTIKIEDGQIVECVMNEYDAKDQIKDETYGDDLDGARKELAKIAYQGLIQYPDLLVETQNVKDIDVISGATLSYKRFKEAVNDALKQAK